MAWGDAAVTQAHSGLGRGEAKRERPIPIRSTSASPRCGSTAWSRPSSNAGRIP